MESDQGEDFYADSDQEDYSLNYVEEFSDNEPEEVEKVDEEKEFAILKQEDIRPRLEDDIAQISSLLSVSREAAIRLLCRSNWSVNTVEEEWFLDEEKVRKACGLSENYPVIKKTSRKNFFCGICLQNYGKKNAISAACGHLFCQTCWQTYIKISIQDGCGCLMLRCPQPSCGTAVGQDLINSLTSDEEKEKYDNYIVRSYIEGQKKIKWCPAPGCNFAVELLYGRSNRDFDVTCDCSYEFCWNCSEEAHSPADCETVAKWLLKNSSESDNTVWIMCNSKPCPSCKKPIEKNRGCMHMTCAAPCKHQFCWLCLGPWKEHSAQTGGFFSCNKYARAKENGEIDEAELKRQKAKAYLDKYAHYYERWAGNHSSRETALQDRKKVQSVHLTKLSEIQAVSEGSLNFIVDAWDQIIECRRVLKWTYAYGYFLPEEEQATKKLFEYLQGEAEAGLERLHHCAENELSEHHEGLSENFNDFRNKLVGLTSATRNYFDNLVRALRNGLSEVDL